MAIAFVQGATATASATQAPAASFTGNTTTGNTIILVLAHNASPGKTGQLQKITDSQGNLYILGFIGGSVANGNTIEIWYATNIIGGITPTITGATTKNVSGGVFLREYSGLGIGTIFDTGNSASYTSVSTTSSGTTPTATRRADELVLGVTATTTAAAVFTVGSGFSNFVALAGAGSQSMAIEDKVVAASAEQVATFGATTSGSGSCAVATFADVSLFQATRLNNYQSARGGDGVSTAERIR